jgi:hypothetical protein
MRIVDKNALAEIDHFWIDFGMLQARAWAADCNKEIHVEAAAGVVEELQKPDAAEKGKFAYYYGIKLTIDYLLSVSGEQGSEAAKNLLMIQIGEVSRVKMTVMREKRMVEKTIVTEHHEDGRIRSWVKVNEEARI